MKVLVLNKDRIDKFKLPKRIEGNVWVTSFDENDVERNIINIEAGKDGNWYFISNNEHYIIEISKRVDNILLEEYKFYRVKDVYSNNMLLLYCLPTYENSVKYYNISSNLVVGITIGNADNCTINYKCPLINNEYANVKLIGDDVYLESRDGVYINDVLVKKAKLNYGDTIFIMGLEIVLLRQNGIYIFVMNNPKGLVTSTLKEENLKIDDKLNKFDEASEEKDFELYTSEDYFYRKPRFIYSVKEFDLQIDSPPSKKEKDEMPAILTIGPMLTMSLTSVVTCMTTINNVQSGNQTWKEATPSLIISGVMVVTLLLWPVLTNLFQKHLDKKNEKKRINKYGEYIDNLKNLIEKEKKSQEEILNKCYVHLNECENIILSKDDRLWERRKEDEDFLCASIGYGDSPLKINVKYPEEHFSMVEDELKDKAKSLGTSEKKLENVPIPFSFRENYIIAIIDENKLKYKLIDNIIFQLVTFHSYDDLKIVIFSSKEKKYNWDKYRLLPHVFSDDKSVRFIADDNDEYKEVAYHLEKVFNQRKEYANSNNLTDMLYNQNYLIITDSFSSVRNYDFIKNIVESKDYYGFSLLILNDKISNLPDQCQTFIELSDTESKIFKNIANNEKQKFKVDLEEINYNKCFKILSNLPIEFTDSSEGVIPKKVGFMEMYEIGKVDQFNCKNRWNENVPLLNMGAIVGIGKNGEKISLDLHEKYHGPHGLIAGMTGSGKSEFIITYILSMAVNYHPYEVQFILIDYKGGGLAGAFENKALGYKLPHLVGTVTNLDKNEINRSLASVESELKRRQDLFNKARDLSGESTIDIYKYQKLYRNGVVKEPVSHLLIICDEFAELKTQQPEFMEQLISTARIGRSLGVHLILATQKPSGVVDSQIWSNTRFRVCLRVQEKSDSSEVIQCPDAAYLTQTGRFYLQVGYNEIFLLGQSAWAGGKYIPSETIKKTIDSSVNFINNIGYVTRTIETKVENPLENINNNGEELINIVKYLDKCAKEENIVARPLWLDKIPEFILVQDLIKKYSYEKEDYILNPVIGEYDIPNMQDQKLLTIPFSKEGNAILYGMAGAGKENFLTTMICSSMLTYKPDEVNYYIVDFGSEVLRYFTKSPIVGDVLYVNDSDKIKNLFKLVSDTIGSRKKLFSEYNGDYISYCKGSNNVIPNIVIIINNYDAFIETYPDYYDTLVLLTRDCVKYGIYFVFTTTGIDSIRYKLRQNFGQNFVLQQNSDDDYSQILGNVRKKYPSKSFGRGLIKLDDIYEFQTAFISEKDKITETVNDLNKILTDKYGIVSRKVPVLPETVIYNDIKNDIKNNEICIGIDKYDLKPCIYDFNKYTINTVLSMDFSLFDNFINPLLYQIENNPNYVNVIINAEDLNIDADVINNSKYFNSNYDAAFDMILRYLNDSINLYNQNNQSKSIFSNRKRVMCTIIGINTFKNKLSVEKQNEFEKLFTTGNELDIINYIIIDTNDKLKNFEYESWYKNNHSNSECIWLGNGLADQFSINITNRIDEMKKDVPYNFCFVVKKGRVSFVKFIEQI